MKVLRTYRLADFGSGLIDETAELKLVAEVSEAPTLEQVLTKGNESTTQDAIFRFDDDRFIKINRESQNIQVWDLTIDVVNPIVTFGTDVISVRNGSGSYSFMETESIGVVSPTNQAVLLADSLVFNSVYYPLPNGLTSQIATKKDIDDKVEPIVVSSSQTAILNRVHNVVATSTLTDPTPVEGMGYPVNVINGIATVGGVDYTVGSELYRHYHSGSWRTFEYVNGKELERFFYSDGDGVLGTPHTGDTLETVLFPIPITAGYFQVKDWMNVLFSINKSTTASTTYRIRIGTTGTTADNLLATFTSSQRSHAFSRYNMQFLTGDLIRAVNSVASTQTDLAGTSSISSVSVNPSNAFYLTLTAQLTDSAEQVQCIGARVSRIKPSN